MGTAATGVAISARRHGRPQLIFAPLHGRHSKILLQPLYFFAGTNPCFCYHPLTPKSATVVIFVGTGEPFCYNCFGFLLLPVFGGFFATSISMTSSVFFCRFFCYNHALILLEPKINIATTIFSFCWNQRQFLLHPPTAVLVHGGNAFFFDS